MPSTEHKLWTNAKAKAAKMAEDMDKETKKGRDKAKKSQSALLLDPKPLQAPIVKALSFSKGLGKQLDKADEAGEDFDKCMVPTAAALKILEGYEKQVKALESRSTGDQLDEEIAAMFGRCFRVLRGKLNGQRKQAKENKAKAELEAALEKRKRLPKKKSSDGKGSYEALVDEREIDESSLKEVVLVNFPNILTATDINTKAAANLGLKKLKFVVKIEDKASLKMLAKVDSTLLRAEIWEKAVDMQEIYEGINKRMLVLLRNRKYGEAAKAPMTSYLDQLGDIVLVKAVNKIAKAKKMPEEVRTYRFKKAGEVALILGPSAAMVLTSWTTGVGAVVSIATATVKLTRLIRQELASTERLITELVGEVETLQSRLKSSASWKNLAKDTGAEILNSTLLGLGIMDNVGDSAKKLDTVAQNNKVTQLKWSSVSKELDKLLTKHEALTRALEPVKSLENEAITKGREKLGELEVKIDSMITNITDGMESLKTLKSQHGTLKKALTALQQARDAGTVLNSLAWLAGLAVPGLLQTPFTMLAQTATNLDTSALALTTLGGDLKAAITEATVGGG